MNSYIHKDSIKEMDQGINILRFSSIVTVFMMGAREGLDVT